MSLVGPIIERRRARCALHVDAQNGARVAHCAGCAQPFYSRDRGTHCQVCAPPAPVAALHTCTVCGHRWEGPGAGAAGDACPMLGCAGRV